MSGSGGEQSIVVSGTVTLGQLLKAANLVGSGGEAKIVIGQGDVRVNEAVETRRGRKMEPGDVVEFAGHTVVVEGPPRAGEAGG